MGPPQEPSPLLRFGRSSLSPSLQRHGRNSPSNARLSARFRSAIEKGQQLDAALVEKMLKPRTSRDRDGLLIGGAVCLAVGLGMPVMGYFISLGGDNEAVYPMAGVGALVTMIGIALLAARRFVSQSDASSEPPSFER